MIPSSGGMLETEGTVPVGSEGGKDSDMTTRALGRLDALERLVVGLGGEGEVEDQLIGEPGTRGEAACVYSIR